MKLFVDDTRECPKGWEIARNVTDAIRILSTGLVKKVSLDFDIRACSNKRCQDAKETFEPAYRYIKLMTNKPEIMIHTGNIEAGRAMATMLRINYTNQIYDPINYGMEEHNEI